MAKIDTSNIAGFDTMSDSEKLNALLNYEAPEADYSGYIRKEQFDKTASELAATKKNLKSLQDSQLTDTQRFEQEKADFAAEKAAFNRERNATAIRGIFAKAGMTEEQYSRLDISHFEDAKDAENFANGIVSMLSSVTESAKATERSNLLGATPPQSGSDPSKVSALQSEFESAKKAGNSQAMVRLIREASSIGVQLT